MPFFRAGERVVYFVHVPKCGGTSVEEYLQSRFGPVAFLNNRFMDLPEAARWSRTSPQHIDRETLAQLFPDGFFDAAFAVVRHPVARILSTYHFQVAVEKRVPPGLAFADWLRQQVAARERDPFLIDNHFRPQMDFLPEGCAIFHLEHGLDALVPFLDALAGSEDGARFIGHVNRREAGRSREAVPRAEDLALIAEIYAADFAGLGYLPDQKLPARPKPVLAADFLARNARARARAARPLNRLAARIRRGIRRRLGQ